MHKRTIQGAVALVILWGLLALLGWHFNVPLLKSGLTGSPIPMKANTAFCLVLCGIALGILQYQRLPPIWIKIAQGIALCVVVVGGLALSQSLWDWDLGIDGWLYPVQNSSTDALIPHPHRMGQNSALNFILIGFALLLFPQKTRCSNWLGQILSCIATIVAMTALVGHLFVTNVNYILVYGAVNMAPSTAMIFLLLCIGLLLTRPYRGLMQPLSSPLLGGMLARQTLPWAIVMPIGLGWLVRQGEKLGWYDSAFSDVIDVIVLMVGFSILVWWNARLLNRSEVHRLQIETDLRQTHESRNRANERNATLQQETQRLAAIVDSQRSIAQHGSNLEEVMTFIVERAQELTGADGSVVELVEGEQLVYRAASGKAAPYVGLRLSKTSSLSGHCVETGNVISCPDVETDVRVDLKACHQIGVQSMVVVPLLQKDACLGVLKVLSTQTHFFSDREVQSLQLMAAFLANSIQLALEFDAKNALLGALEHSEAKYRSVINSLSEGIVLQDAESAILTSNASAEFILGLSLDQMMGRSSLDPRWKAIHEDGSPFPGEQHPAMVTLQTGVPVHNVVMGVHKPDGNLTWISINSQPLCHSGEVLPYAVVTSFSDITERKWAEAKIRASEQELRALFEAIHDVVLVRDAEGRCLKILSHCAGHLVKSPEEMLHKTLHETLPKAQADLLFSSIQQALALKKTVKCDYGLQIGEKETWFAANISPLSSNTAILVIRDISDRKTLEQELFREKELAQVTLHSIGDAVITTDAEGNIQYFNPVAEMLTGWSHAQSIGLPLSEVFNIVNETTRIEVDNPVVEALREDRIVGLANHTVLICRDGREIAIEDSAAPIRDHHGNLVGAVLVFHDVTQTRSLTRQLSWQASHDSLTQLVNRREFEIRVEQALVSAQSKALCHALGYLDLDQFKIVNDTCGHGAGDELLRQVTALLQSQVRKTDTLARLGGDEFGVLLDRCPLPQALRIANEMRECIQRFRFVWEEQTFKIGVSIGLITIDANSKSLSDVLSAADAACYSAKDKGRNRVHVFRTDDRDLLQQRGEMQWATRISRALEEDRFCLYYQTITAIEPLSQNCEHYEVLLRLQDETGMLVSPMAFIPAAERYGLMHLIDRWVIRALFAAQGQHYQDIWNQCEIQGNFCNSLYAINLSGASINDDRFIEFLHEQFRLYQIPPQLICFEITETVAIANLTKASQFIRELKQLGCCFALDDFGSGMSSFAYLRNLPVDYLKIDGEFVRNIIDRPVDDAMVEAMCRIGHVMGIKIIAEFVENDAILARLKSLGVDYAQGYGIAKPLPLLEPHPVD